MLYTVTNDYDSNFTFEVEADSYEDALCAALESLGWFVSPVQANDDDDDEEI